VDVCDAQLGDELLRRRSGLQRASAALTALPGHLCVLPVRTGIGSRRRSPVEIRQGAAGGKELVLEKTRLEPGQKGQEQRAVGTGETETLGVDLVLKSIGYKSVPVEGIPWDDRRSVARNVAGRVVEADGSPVAGMYVCGWLRRGPTGIIGTNLIDAEETVDVITDDVNNKRLPAVQAIQPGGAGLLEKLKERRVQHVSKEDWQVIDSVEVQHGRSNGKVREKFTSTKQMLDLVCCA